MSDWNFQHAQKVATYTPDATPLTMGVAVTAHASAHTKGAWATLGTTAYPTKGMIIHFVGSSAVLRDFFVDIGVGAGGSEVVLYSNLLFSIGSWTEQSFWYPLPCDLPAGTTISARCQASTGASAMRVLAHVFYTGFHYQPWGGHVTTYAAVTASTTATNFPDADNNDDAKGVYTEVTSGLTYPARALMFAQGNLRTASVGDNVRLVDIAIGAAASEHIIVPDLRTRSGDSPDHHAPAVIGPIPVNLPAGTRISVRSEIDTNTVGATWEGVMYAIH
jgi:hypothetical protein